VDSSGKTYESLYDDFTTSSFNTSDGEGEGGTKWSVFDELDDPEFRPLWSDAKVAAYDAALLTGGRAGESG